MTAGFDVYLSHVLSLDDLNIITSAKTTLARTRYYEERRGRWILNLQTVANALRAQGYAGKTAVLGTSLGAQTAALAAFKRVPVDAVVLVDGAPTAAETSQRPPPFHLIWGSADDVFPVSTGQSFSKQIEQAGGKATMTVFEGGHHDFFLKPENAAAQDFFADAIRFLAAQLRR